MKHVIFTMVIVASFCFAEKIYLSDLDISKTQQEWGVPQKDLSVNGNPLQINGTSYQKGLGTHAGSTLLIKLAGGSTRFKAVIGLDDEVDNKGGQVQFKILVDGKQAFSSPVLSHNSDAVNVDIPLENADNMVLIVDSLGANTFDHADWANAYFETNHTPPQTDQPKQEEPYILTPKAPEKPLINSSKVFGVRPGSPVLYTVVATGQRPMTFSAKNLPSELSLNKETGQITGKFEKEGTYKFTITAKNKKGHDRLNVRFEVGQKICLTPPLGWNSWNVWGCDIDENKIRDAADAMVESGLINYGWQYINIDDCWMVRKPESTIEGKPEKPVRDSEGNILCNEFFPDMKALTDYIHSLGLKVGTYISPGPFTCQRFEGSYKHEMQDAIQFAQWGFDYLKYDWCGYSRVVPKEKTLDDMKAPYILMGQCLRDIPRDIVYSLCQYGMGDVWEWGAEVGGNCWRTTGDITDTWSSVSNLLARQEKLAEYAGPGGWNDPDMLVVGQVGWSKNLHKSRLTPSEQYTHITMWSMLNSPLLIGCDMTQLDDFTLNLLTNREVLAVNQDPLGMQARIVSAEDGCNVWFRKLEDGCYAAALVNMTPMEAKCKFVFSKAAIEGKYHVRDLWRQKDLGAYRDSVSFDIKAHGCMMIKLSR